MIAYIKGKVIQINEKSLVVLSNNLGWEIFCPNINQYLINVEVELFTYMHIREDDITVFGFKNNDELNIFKLLLTVSGVGPRIGLTLLEERGIQKILYSIEQNNFEDLKVSGVGIKTAQKIVIELRNKIDKYSHITNGTLANSNKDFLYNNDNKYIMEAIEALKTLGYKEQDINDTIKSISIDKEARTEDIIRLLLTSI